MFGTANEGLGLQSGKHGPLWAWKGIIVNFKQEMDWVLETFLARIMELEPFKWSRLKS